jgi:hypothetical protein
MIHQDVPEKWLHWKLTSDPRTAEQFGFRVYPVIAPQGATRSPAGGILTFAIFKRLSQQRDTKSLDIGPEDEAPAYSIQLDIYAESYAQVRAAAAAAITVLHGATEQAFGSTVLYSLLKTEQDDLVVPVDGKETPIYSVGQQYDIRVMATGSY